MRIGESEGEGALMRNNGSLLMRLLSERYFVEGSPTMMLLRYFRVNGRVLPCLGYSYVGLKTDLLKSIKNTKGFDQESLGSGTENFEQRLKIPE